MPSSHGFVDFAVELLSLVGPVRARAMFGGHGLYCGDVMIGLVDEDELFLKTDDECRQAFLDAGCRRWIYEGGGRRMETAYFRPPDEAHESPEAMLSWAERALAAARRAKAAKRAKPRKASRPAARRPARGPASAPRTKTPRGSRRRSRPTTRRP